MVLRARRKVQRKPRGKGLDRRGKNQVKRMISTRLENKYLGRDVTDTPTTSGVIYNLSQITQGTSENQRIGDQVYLKKLSIRYHAVCGDETNHMRFIIFRWNQDTRTILPTAVDILDTITTGDRMTQFIRWQGPKNFTILYDRVHSLAGDGTYSGDAVYSPWGPASTVFVQKSFYGKSLGAKSISMDAGVTTGRGHIFLMVFSDSAPASLIHPSFGFTSLLEYEDA